MLPGLKAQAVGFHRVLVPDRGGKGNVADSVGFTCLQNLDIVEVVLEIGEDDWLVFQGVGGQKEPAAVLESPLRHCLRHNVNVSRVVQMAVGEDNSAQLLGPELSLG